MFEPIRQLIGKVAVYEFDLPTLEFVEIIEDYSCRGPILPESYWNIFNFSLEFTGRKGKLSWTLEVLTDLESFIKEYQNLKELVKVEILTDDRCLADCGYYASNGFCSIHAHLDPSNYQVAYSEKLRERYRNTMTKMEEFARNPAIPTSFESEIDGHSIRFSLIEMRVPRFAEIIEDYSYIHEHI